IFWINVAIAAEVVVLGVFILMQVLIVSTLHGEQVEVPDVRGVGVEKASELLAQRDLRFEVLDSVYTDGKSPRRILEERPEAGATVKPVRIIYLRINAADIRKVKMPALVDRSFRQGQAKLLSAGLKVGKISYRPDIATDVVLQQLFKGKSVSAET